MDNRTANAPAQNGFTGSLLTIAGFALFLIVVALVWVDQRPVTVAWGVRTGEERLEILRDHREREQAELSAYGWIDRQQGIVRLPIERAMELTVEELNRE